MNCNFGHLQTNPLRAAGTPVQTMLRENVADIPPASHDSVKFSIDSLQSSPRVRRCSSCGHPVDGKRRIAAVRPTISCSGIVLVADRLKSNASQVPGA